jgi:hypothetical protein
VLKWHHPCFFVYSDFVRSVDGFRHDGELSCLFRFHDIASALHGDFFVWQLIGIHHNSTPAHASSTGKRKKSGHTIDIEPGAATKQACLRTCKRRKHVIERKYGLGASGLFAAALLS